MAIPVEQFQPETFAQANPMLTGMMGVADLQNQIYNNQILQAKAGVAQGMAQAGLTQEQAKAGVAPQMAQAGLQQAQAIPGQTKAQTALLASEAAKNQLYAKYPQLLMSGPAGTIGQLDILGQMQPNANVSTQMPAGTQTLPSGLNAQSAGAMGIPTTAQGLTVSPSQFGVGAQTPMQQYQNLLSLQTQAHANVGEWNKAQDDAEKQANDAMSVSNNADQFLSNYKNSTYKGTLEGKFPTQGVWTPIEKALSGTDLSAEVNTDNAANNLAATVGKNIIGGRVTNSEWQRIDNLKPNRGMPDESATARAQAVQAQANRIRELPAYYAQARAMGLTRQQADTGWVAYNQQRNIYDYNTDSINSKYANTYGDYLTPQNVLRLKLGQVPQPTPVAADLQAQGVMPKAISMPSFKSKADFQSWYGNLSPDQQTQIRSQLGGK